MSEQFGLTRRDYRGLYLCDSCWNGVGDKRHMGTDANGNKYRECTGDPCECPCRQLQAETRHRIKKDTSQQTTIPMDNPLVIGPK